tara:strand:- start:5961 stop:6476 length:516 start_codon:yes stop_codon:yes gene_type:complete
MKTEQIYIINYVDNYGNSEIMGATNNPKKWIKKRNEIREDEYKEKLSDFKITRITFSPFNFDELHAFGLLGTHKKDNAFKELFKLYESVSDGAEKLEGENAMLTNRVEMYELKVAKLRRTISTTMNSIEIPKCYAEEGDDTFYDYELMQELFDQAMCELKNKVARLTKTIK